MNLQSDPSIPPILGLAKSGGIPKMAVLGVIYQIISPTKPLFGTWKWAAVLGGAVLRGTTVDAII